jgi:hypothetical protein
MSKTLSNKQQDWTCQVCWQGCGLVCFHDIVQSPAVLSSYLTQSLFLLLLLSYPRSTHPFKNLRYTLSYISESRYMLMYRYLRGITKGFLLWHLKKNYEEFVWSIMRSWSSVYSAIRHIRITGMRQGGVTLLHIRQLAPVTKESPKEKLGQQSE